MNYEADLANDEYIWIYPSGPVGVMLRGQTLI